MISASPPPAIVTRKVDSKLHARGGVIQLPAVDGVSAQLIYPANDMPSDERVHIEATGPIGIKSLDIAPFGGNSNYAPYYQLRIAPTGPATVVHFFGAPKLILHVFKPIPTAHYGLQATMGSNYNIQMGASGDSSEPQFDLTAVPSIFENGVLTINLRNSTAVVVISTVQLATTIQGRVEEALGKLEVYKRSHSLGDLQTAIDAMQQSLDVHLFRANAFTLQRRAFVRGWAHVLRSVEDAYDPKFDPDKRLPCPLPRAGEPQGDVVPLVCDPIIREPQNDAVRNKELQDLERYRISYEHYREVKRLDDQSMSILEMSLNVLSKTAPPQARSDYLALDRILLDSAIADSRRIKIEAMLRDPSLGYVTLSGQAVRALRVALAGALLHLDNATLARQQVEIGISNRKITVIFARDHGDLLTYQVDAQTGAVTDLKQTVPISFERNGVVMSALDAKAVILLYNKMLSGALAVLPPPDDFRAENFVIQQRNFDRSHTKPDTRYYEIYLPQTVPKNAGKLPCGYFRNYQIETSTWTVATEPLNC